MLVRSASDSSRWWKKFCRARAVALQRSEVEAALAAKGFVLDERAHRFYRLHVDGRYTGIQTMVSTGTKYRTLGDSLVSQMARQVQLTARQFRELIECTLSAGGYLEILRSKGIVE